MRCKACNDEMTDEDAVRKWPPNKDGTRDYVDMCRHCYCAALDIEDNDFLAELTQEAQDLGFYD